MLVAVTGEDFRDEVADEEEKDDEDGRGRKSQS